MTDTYPQLTDSAKQRHNNCKHSIAQDTVQVDEFTWLFVM